MKVDNKLLEDMSRLAKLNFDKQTIEEMKSDFEKILEFVDKLSEIDTEGIEPLIYLSNGLILSGENAGFMVHASTLNDIFLISLDHNNAFFTASFAANFADK